MYVCMQDAIFGRFGLIRGNNLSHAVLPHNYPCTTFKFAGEGVAGGELGSRRGYGV